MSDDSYAGSASDSERSVDSANGLPRVQLPASCGPPRPGHAVAPLVWIVFGGTGHIGRSVVRCALAHGDHVATVGRTLETAPTAMQTLAAAAEQTARVVGGSGTCLGALCDVRERASVELVVRQTLARFGRIDIVANCSGYGVVGACEDQDEHELHNQFETNFMGTLHILQATLPVLRQQIQRQGPAARAGRYLIFSSTAGALGVPGLGPYCATKYAVEGLMEAMQHEVDWMDIKTTLVEPGYVRRDDAGGGGGGDRRRDDPTDASAAADSLPTWGHFLIKPPSAPYAAPSAPARHATRLVQWLGDRQPTSVVLCAELVWQLAHCAFPPLRLPLGSYAIESIRDRLRSVTEELEDWRHLHFPVVEGEEEYR